MSHEITSSDKMFSHQEVPWHFSQTGKDGRAVVTDRPPADIDELLSPAFTNTEWLVEPRPVFTVSADLEARLNKGESFTELPMDDILQVEGMWANVRSDINVPLGIVGDRHEPLQNRDAAEFIQAVIENGDAHFETGGSLKMGRLVWYMLKLEETAKFPGGEEHEPFIFCCNYHDGKGSFTCATGSVRVVCQNTVNAALHGAKTTWKIRHTANLKSRLEQARIALGFAHHANEKLAEIAHELVTRKFTTDDQIDILGKLYPVQPESSPLTIKNMDSRREEVLAAIIHSPNLGNVRDTAWGTFQGIVEYVDHGKQYRSPEARMLSLMTENGTMKQFKSRALDLVVAKAGIEQTGPKVPITANVG